MDAGISLAQSGIQSHFEGNTEQFATNLGRDFATNVGIGLAFGFRGKAIIWGSKFFKGRNLHSVPRKDYANFDFESNSSQKFDS